VDFLRCLCGPGIGSPELLGEGSGDGGSDPCIIRDRADQRESSPRTEGAVACATRGAENGRLVNLNIWRDVLVRYSSNVQPTRIGRLGKSTLGTCYVARRVGIFVCKVCHALIIDKSDY
jgi:hypothetical protein